MKKFASTYGFEQVTSSPYFPQSNGLAERGVRTMKRLLEDTQDAYLALLSYRATPLAWCGLSPAELLMGRCVKTDVPQPLSSFIPSWPHLKGFEEKNRQYKQKQKNNYDHHHRVRPLPSLSPGTDVWVTIQGGQEQGRISTTAPAPRSYLVDTPSGCVRRNRHHIIPQPATADTPTNARDDLPPNVANRPVTRSTTGTAINPPDRLSYHRKGDVA